MKTDTFTNTIIVEDTTRVLPELIKSEKQTALDRIRL